MIDLSTWNLTIPTEPTPQVITTQQLNNGYQSRYFQQGNDGGLVFWVPIDGSHTEDSTYPRTELRETQADGSLDNWYYWQADNELRVTMSVEKVPSKNKVIIGQIHSKSPQTDDGEPLVKLQYYYKPEEGLGRVEALVRNHPDDSYSRNVSILEQVRLGERFNYSLRVTSSGELAVRAHSQDGEEDAYYQTLGSAWNDQLLYFKAGAYVNDNAGDSGEGSRVTIYHLNTAHR
ncbi:polysaccharide lyase family 7 protein [Pseudomonas aeruginosa]